MGILIWIVVDEMMIGESEKVIGEGEKMPTLEQLLQLSDEAPEMLLNIEVKAPETPEVAARYDL